MAYGLKFTHNFHQIKDYGNSSEWKIEIYQEGWAGVVKEVKCDRNSINLSREGDLLTVVQGSKLTLSIINESEGEYKAFRTADWGEYMIKLIKDPNGTPLTKFVGYNQSEIYTEPYDQPPYSSVLEFTCGLSHLKHVKWDDSGTLYEGQKSMIEVIRLALNKLPSPLAIREFVNVYENSINSATTDSPLNQIYVDSSVYKTEEQVGGEPEEVAFYCNEVLEENIKPFAVNIFQADGIWYIVRVQEYLDSTMYYRDFNANVGTESTITVDGTGSFTTNTKTVTGPNGLSTELVLVAPESELSIEPPLNRVQVTYNQTNLDQESSNFIKNGCWSIKDYDSGTGYYVPDFWTYVGSDPTTYSSTNYDGNANGAEEWYHTFDPATQGTAEAIDTGVYMQYEKDNMPTATVDSMQINFSAFFNVGLSSTSGQQPPTSWINSNLTINYEVEVKLGTYYLHGDIINGFSWSTTVGRATFTKVGVNLQNAGSGAGFASYNAWAYFDFSQNLPTLPETAFVDFRFRIYQPYTNVAPYDVSDTDWTFTAQEIRSTCWELIYLPLEAAPTEELILYSTINEDENVEEIEVSHADGTNSGTLNSYRISNGLITDEWTRRGAGDDTDILTILLTQLGDLRGDYVRELSAKVIGELDVFNTIEHTTDVLAHYYIKTYDWAIETSEYSVTLSELETSLLPVVIVKSPLPSVVNPNPDDTPNNPLTQGRLAVGEGTIATKGNKTNIDQTDTNNYI